MRASRADRSQVMREPLDGTVMFRWLILAILVSAIGTSGYFRYRARIEGGTIARREEGAAFVALRVFVTLPLLGAIVTYVLNPDWMAWSAFAAPTWMRWGGVVLGVLAIPTVYWVLQSLGSNVSETVLTKANHELVTVGPYRWVRHPLYATGLTLLVAVGLMAANAVLLLFALLASFLIRLVVIPREEAALEQQFGEEYRRYMMQTGRLLPTGRGYVPSVPSNTR
jgi:protein-S-isoprenylcysteine O-methyltransferase Ste14